MDNSPHWPRFWLLLEVSLLIAALSFCKAILGAAPLPTVPSALPSIQPSVSAPRPTATQINIPTRPATPASTPNPTSPPQATSTPALDLRDRVSVLTWILRGIQNQDSLLFKHLIDADRLLYANYIEGGQTVDTARFLADLEKRLASRPSCLGVTEGNEGLQLWTTGWAPAWQMEEICYIECTPLKPPWKSSTAGFLLFQHDGLWKLDAVYLNTPENYLFTPTFPLYRCDPPFTELVDETPEPFR